MDAWTVQISNLQLVFSCLAAFNTAQYSSQSSCLAALQGQQARVLCTAFSWHGIGKWGAFSFAQEGVGVDETAE